jgi:hypothetical protein
MMLTLLYANRCHVILTHAPRHLHGHFTWYFAFDHISSCLSQNKNKYKSWFIPLCFLLQQQLYLMMLLVYNLKLMNKVLIKKMEVWNSIISLAVEKSIFVYYFYMIIYHLHLNYTRILSNRKFTWNNIVVWWSIRSRNNIKYKDTLC